MSKNPKNTTTSATYFVKTKENKLVPMEVSIKGKFSEEQVEEFLKKDKHIHEGEETTFYALLQVS